MTKKDYYDILGVERGATKEDIKKAYKALAKKYHPDISKEPDAAEKFKEINEAAAVLGDDKKRAHYDQFGTAEGMGGAGAGGFDFSDFMQDIGGFGFDFGSIFDSFFGGGRGRRRASRGGADLRFDIEISLEEAAAGVAKNIVLPKLAVCSKCNGSGAEGRSGRETCPDCNGTGVFQRTQRTPFGLFQTSTTCRKCEGTGSVIKNPCTACRGEGRVGRNERIKIKIPAGIDEGSRLRISGAGEAGPQNSPPGDLYVVIHIKEHPLFERQGNDIYTEIPISFYTAAIGGEVEAPTLSGKAKLKIPAGTQTNTIFRMKGKGIPDIHGYGSGDEKVKVIIETPRKLSKKQRELLEEFAVESGEKKKEKKKGLFK